jgi:hypothetical protein
LDEDDDNDNDNDVEERHGQRLEDKHADKFIMKFLKKRVIRPTAGSDEDVRIKPYKNMDEVEQFERTWRYADKTLPKLGPKKEATRTPIVRLQDLESLEAMSPICAAASGVFASTIDDANLLGLLQSPFPETGTLLKSYVAGTPLYNVAYAVNMEKLNDIFQKDEPGPLPMGIIVPNLANTADVYYRVDDLWIVIESFVKM